MKALLRIHSRSIFFAWALVIGALSLILRSGLYSDDLPDYQKWQSMAPVSFMQMLHIVYGDIIQTLHSGRFLPVSYLLQGLLFWISDSILIYKISLFCFNILAVYSFSRLLYSLGLRVYVPLSLLVFCSLAQFYADYHDSILAFHAMFPLLATLIFSTVTCFIVYLRDGKMSMLIWSFLSAALAVYDSEIGFVIYPILLILLIGDRRSFSSKCISLFPFVFLLILYIPVFILIRVHAQGMYHGIETGFEMARMSQVVFFQIFATLPLTAFINMSAIPRFILIGIIHLWPMLLFFGLSFYRLIKADTIVTSDTCDRTTKKKVVLMGLVLWIVPAFILMVSKKYQAELNFGRGYLPVYIQNFGLAMIMTILLGELFEKYSNMYIKKAVVVLLFLVFIMTFLRNDFINSVINNRRSVPACFYYKSLKNGILKDCEQGAVVVLKTDYFFHCPLFYQQIVNNFYQSGLQIIPDEDFKQYTKDEKRPFYILEHDHIRQCTLLYKVFPDQNKLVKQINYPVGADFSYFDLISRPL